MPEHLATTRLLDTPPPNGCRIDEVDGRPRLTVSTRWLAVGLATVFVSFWVCMGVFSLWTLILGLRPSWAPQPVSPMPLAAVIVVFVIVVPGTYLAVRMLVQAAMSIAGRVEVTVDEHHLIVWSGIGPLGRTRYVDLFKPEQIQFKQSNRDGSESVIGVEVHRGNVRTKLVSGVPEERLWWLAAVLRDLSGTGSD